MGSPTEPLHFASQQASRPGQWLRGWRGRAVALCTGLLGLALGLAVVGATLQSQSRSSAAAAHSGTIPAAEFSRLIRDFSEQGGYFFSDNFTSNESAYLYILGPLKQYSTTGGAYVGVGPEQNFTYIAHLRPEIAFIVDIRRQAIIQHLMYKAIFHLAEDRAQFLSILFSKPMVGPDIPKRDAPIEEILKYISSARTSEEAYHANLSRLERAIEQDFQFPLSSSDQEDLSYVFGSFWKSDLRISFRMQGNGGFYGGQFPNLADLILATDQNGKLGNFLAKEDDYEFVRRLQEQNRIIPVVGDFGGTKALARVGDYLRKNGYTLTAFYTSNVEQFLFDGQSFPNFVSNVRHMPINDKSVIIRAVRAGGPRHPAWIPGARMTPLLELVSIFLRDFDAGLYPDYWSLITTHYISAPHKP
jgi:hypothetical protein